MDVLGIERVTLVFYPSAPCTTRTKQVRLSLYRDDKTRSVCTIRLRRTYPTQRHGYLHSVCTRQSCPRRHRKIRPPRAGRRDLCGPLKWRIA